MDLLGGCPCLLRVLLAVLALPAVEDGDWEMGERHIGRPGSDWDQTYGGKIGQGEVGGGTCFGKPVRVASLRESDMHGIFSEALGVLVFSNSKRIG